MIEDEELEKFIQDWLDRTNTPEYKENRRKIVDDLMTFGAVMIDQDGKHVPFEAGDGECEICKKDKP